MAYCNLTTNEVQDWLVTWIRANTANRKFRPYKANVSAATWARAAKAFAEWIAFYSVREP
jgi:hypothetical protein